MNRAVDAGPVPGLSAGDLIGVAAPAYPADRGSLQAGIDYLESLGYRTRLGDGISERRGYLAGSDSQRAASLNDLIADPEVRALFFARGGYGTARVIDEIDLDGIRQQRKLVLGFSDLTVLLLALQKKGAYPVGYGPHVADLGKPSRFQARSLRRFLSEGPGGERFSLARCKVLVPGKATGPLVGGCLTLLQTSIGTAWAPCLDGAILFWEEWMEEPYRIDRMLQHLRHAGFLDNLAGMVVGRPIRISSRRRPSLAYEEIILDHVGGLGYPVVTGLAAGHGPRKITLSLGGRAGFDTERGILETY